MDQEIVKRILDEDSNFNEATFKSYVDNIFVKVYSAVMFDEMDTVRHFMGSDVFEKFSSRVENLNKKNLRQMYDELNVKSTEIVSFESTSLEFLITVKLVSRYLDYYLEKDSGDFVSGDRDTRVEMVNYLTFSKKRNFLTHGVVRKCPGCGASISVNTNGVCEYCGTSYRLDDYDYILIDIKSE